MSQPEETQQQDRRARSLPINYEVPLTYLIGCVVSICSALVYAGASANSMSRKLDDAVEVGKVLLRKHEEVNIKVLDLSVQQKLTDARVFQVETRTDRLEQRK